MRSHREVADAVEALLRDPAATSFAWCRLAGAWSRFADLDAARDCLAHARPIATTAEQLADLACSYRMIGDVDTARAIIPAAEAVERGAWWHVAFAWRDAGDAVRADECLRRGCREADTFSDALALTLGIGDLDAFDTDDPSGPLQRLAALATDAHDWLSLTRIHHSRFEIDDETRCCDRARDLATDPDTRHLIAFRRNEWIADSPEVIGMPRLRPSRILGSVAQRTPPGWQADPDRLFDRLRGAITPTALVEIAENDYGYSEAAHADLRAMCELGTIAHPFWDAREECQLERWSEGARTDHLSRAFACCVLCIDACGPSTGDLVGGSIESAVPTLVESCIELGPEYVDDAVGLFVALANGWLDQHAAQILFVELGLVLVAAARDRDDPHLVRVVDRLLADELRIAPHAQHPGPPRWLLRASNFDQRHQLFRVLATRCCSASKLPQVANIALLLA